MSPQTFASSTFFERPTAKALHALGEAIGRALALIEHHRHVGILHDRSGDKLRKAAYIEHQLERVALHGALVTVHVNRVGQHLKGVKEMPIGSSSTGMLKETPKREVTELTRNAAYLK